MKNLFVIIVFAMTTNLNAKTLSFPSFRIEIQDGWEHSIEKRPGDEGRSVISLRDPNGVGILKIGSYGAPAVVSEDILRNMTNLECGWTHTGTLRTPRQGPVLRLQV